MSERPTLEARVLAAGVEFIERRLESPLRLSSGTITDLTEARAWTRVRVADREAIGRGSVYLSDVWAWPDPARPHPERDRAMRAVCSTLAGRLPELAGPPGHPLQLGLRLHGAIAATEGGPLRTAAPLLARVLCASPFDAAIHDATGIALGRSAFALYEDPAPIADADHLFGTGGAVEAIRRVLRPPRQALDAWWVVGRDEGVDAELAQGAERGFRCYKLKLLGQTDAGQEAAWTSHVFRQLRNLGVASPVLSADANGGYASAEGFEGYLDALESLDGEAYAALRYVEQPTGGDLRSSAHDWHDIGRRKPVIADEGLTGLEALDLIAGQGWSGIAIKTCKGHSICLVAAAWAAQRHLRIAMQDLTNPGYAAIHAALFAARLSTINGVELNSPQFTPDANRAWLPRLAGIFEPRDGRHHIAHPDAPGLGSGL